MNAEQAYHQLRDRVSTINIHKKTKRYIPIDAFIGEAYDLLLIAKNDREQLIAAGLKEEIIDTLEIKILGLSYAEALWTKDRLTQSDERKEWVKTRQKMYDLREELRHYFRFAFREHSDLISYVQRIQKGSSDADLVQDLSDLAVLGSSQTELLAAIGFDEALLTHAEELVRTGSIKLAKAGVEKMVYESRILRDQFYYYLRESVDEIRTTGKFVFRKDPERKRMYGSQYINEMNLRHRKA